MEIGISTASFFSREMTESALNVIKKLSIPTCEVFLATFFEYTDSFCQELLSRKGDLNIYSVHTLNQQFEPELFNPVPRTRNDSEQIFRQVCRVGGALDAKYYTFHGPAKLKKVKYNFDYPKIGGRLEELCQITQAESGGKMKLSYENVHWTYYSEPEYIKNLSPYTNINTTLDIKQAMQSKIDVYEYIKYMGNRLANVHLCDYNIDGSLTIPGKGIFDFTKLFAKLLSIGYDGPAMIEVYSPNYSGYDDLARCYDYLNECLEKAKSMEVE